MSLELKKQKADIEKLQSDVVVESGRVAVQKVDCLTDLLQATYVAGKENDLRWMPVLTDSEAKEVKSKLMELIKGM